MTTDRPDGEEPCRVLVLGATGTIGRATVRALVSRGHEVVCLVRRRADAALPPAISQRIVDLTDPSSLARDGVRGEAFDVLVSCLASRTGLPDDAWATRPSSQRLNDRPIPVAQLGNFLRDGNDGRSGSLPP